MTGAVSFTCVACGASQPLNTRDWRCACGGLFDLSAWPQLEVAELDATRAGLWRYRAWLPIDTNWEPVSLGEGNTPLVHAEWDGQPLRFKMESVEPTGSFKDRGAAVLVTALRGMGIQSIVEDSSGNAGASLAAYAARTGIGCEVCVPNTASGPKLAQMAAHGTEVIEIRGRRGYAALAAWAAAAHGAYYASHVYSPFFLAGVETLAYELWEELGHQAPSAIVLPVGNGTLLLGIYRGFHRLHQAGLASHLPRLLAVQAKACAPIYEAFRDGRETVEAVSPAATAAEGIAISQPARGEQILAAVRAVEGAVVSVTEDEILGTRNELARRGFYVEESSAVAVAGLVQLRDLLDDPAGGPVVVPLTGHGLKSYAGN